MQSSEKSISLEIFASFLSIVILISASKLDPISLLALLFSMLILQTFLILINSIHFLLSFSFLKVSGKLINFSRCILFFLFIYNLNISSVVNDKIGANHLNKELRMMFNKIIVDCLFLELFGSQYKVSFLISK